MKKLLLDSCTKTAFSYDNVIYQQNEDVHLLDLKIMNNGEINIYVKDTNGGLYINYSSYKPWHTKNAWIRTLYDRAYKVFKNDNLFHK